MDAQEHFQKAADNYNEFARDPTNFRLLKNALISMDEGPEHLALHQLGYPQLSREALNEEAQKIRRIDPEVGQFLLSRELLLHCGRHGSSFAVG